MAEQQQQQPEKCPIPALPLTTIQAKRIKIAQAKKAAAAERKAQRNAMAKTRICVGVAFERWRKFKEEKRLRSDAEVAVLLLDQYEQLEEWAAKPCECGRKRQLPGSGYILTYREQSSDEDADVSPSDTLEDRMDAMDSWIPWTPQQEEGPVGAEMEEVGPSPEEGGVAQEEEDLPLTEPPAPRPSSDPSSQEHQHKAVTSGDTHSCSDRELSEAAITVVIGCREEENVSSDKGDDSFEEGGELEDNSDTEEGGELEDNSDTDWKDEQDEQEQDDIRPRELCTDCGSFIKCLKSHRCKHKTKPFSCTVCGKGFATDRKLFLHNQMFHMGSHKRVCKFCFSTFETIPEKLAHERSHPPAKKPYQCPDCPEAFTTFKGRREHMSTSHIVCHICGFRFDMRNKLQRHLVVHTGEKKFVCNFCQRSFNQPGHLKSHMRLHTGEKPYSCQHCDKSFNHNVSLKSHIKRHHGPDQDPDAGIEVQE